MTAGTMGARLREWETISTDEFHISDCDSQSGPPGPFPCDCDGPRLVAALLADASRLHAALVEYGKAQQAVEAYCGPSSPEWTEIWRRRENAWDALCALAAELAEEEK